jgi:hypothetical protein
MYTIFEVAGVTVPLQQSPHLATACASNMRQQLATACASNWQHAPAIGNMRQQLATACANSNISPPARAPLSQQHLCVQVCQAISFHQQLDLPHYLNIFPAHIA